MEEKNVDVVLDQSEEVEEVDNTEEVKKTEDKVQEKTFTQKEVDEIVKSRLAREKKEQEEAKKLAKMNAEENAMHMAKKRKKS